MVWHNGGAGSKIPESIKRTVRRQQHNQCNTIDPTVCLGVIQEFDHIINVKALGIARSEANDVRNIQGLCIPCHKVKTAGEAKAGRRKHLRPPPQHPGLVQMCSHCGEILGSPCPACGRRRHDHTLPECYLC